LLIPIGFARVFAGLLGISRFWIWFPLTLVLWSASLANTVYLRFFGQRLDFWIVKLHWSDLFAVGGSVEELGTTWPVLASIAIFGVGVFAAYRIHRLPRRRMSQQAPFSWNWLTPRLKAAGSGLMVLVAALLLRQSP